MSPLYPLLSSSTIITHLNDVELDSTDEPIDRWTHYLSHDRREKEDDYDTLGYCLPLSSFTAPIAESHDECCFGTTIDAAQHPLCFSTSTIATTASTPTQSDSNSAACLSALSFFPPSVTIPPRCLDNRSCERGLLCARMSDFEQVLMIGIKQEGEEMGRVVVSQGDRRNVFRDGTSDIRRILLTIDSD